MKTSTIQKIADPVFRSPATADGALLYRLARAAGTLDVNSEYAYLLFGHHHANTSIIAEIDGQAAGFVGGYIVPGSDGTILFVWQVGVHPAFRGQGLARNMLLSLLARSENQHVRKVETTITPSNTASLHLFQSLARSLSAEMNLVGTLSKEFFASAHEEETIYQIGPITHG